RRDESAADRFRTGHAGSVRYPPGGRPDCRLHQPARKGRHQSECARTTTDQNRKEIQALKDIRKKLLATFQIEHKEHLKYIRDILAASTQAGGPPAATDLDEIFRRAHSLKGAA